MQKIGQEMCGRNHKSCRLYFSVLSLYNFITEKFLECNFEIKLITPRKDLQAKLYINHSFLKSTAQLKPLIATFSLVILCCKKPHGIIHNVYSGSGTSK